MLRCLKAEDSCKMIDCGATTARLVASGQVQVVQVQLSDLMQLILAWNIKRADDRMELNVLQIHRILYCMKT